MNNDYSESSIYIVCALCLLLLFLQQYFVEAFVYIWKWFALAVLFPLMYLPEMVTKVLFFWMGDISDTVSGLIYRLLKPTPYIVEKYGIGFIGFANEFINALIVPYLLVFFIHYTMKNLKQSDFKRKFSIDTLITDQADLWPQIKPMVNVFPQKTRDLDEGEWAMGAEPLGFSKKMGLIKTTEDKMGEKKIELIEEKVRSVFKAQLGRVWKGVDDLTQEERFILAIFLPKANREDKESQLVRKKVATAYTTEKKYSKKELAQFWKEAIEITDQMIDKYKDSEVFRSTVAQHYYVNTVLPRMLEMARVDGVLANADFIWLKIRNRTLWYILNNVGRNASWIECAGIWHHYNYEKAIERKIPAPNISGAISALDWEFRNNADNYIPLSGYNKDLN